MENNFSSVWHNGDAARQSGGPTFMIKKPGASIATEHAGEPPLRWGEYPNDMEINTQQSLEYDENRARFRGVRVDQDFIAERQQQPEGSQITDPVWIQASKNLYKFMHPTKSTPPTTYDVGPMSNLERERIRPEEGQPDADFTNEDYANWGVEFMSRFNYNITAMLFDANRMQNAPPEMAKSMYYLMETADRDGITGGNFARGFSNFMSDPATYVGLGTFGIGLVGKNAGQQLGKMAFKELLKKTVLAMPTKASLAVGAEGAVFAAADDLARQSINIKADQQEGVDAGQTALAAGTGAVLGDRLSAGAPAAIEAITRGVQAIPGAVKAIPDVVNAIGDELTSDTMFSNPVGTVVDAIGKVAGEPPTLATLVDTPHPGAPRTREIADARIELQQEENKKALALGEKPKKTTNVVKIEDLATYFDEDHLATYGRKLDPTNPTDQQTAAQTIASGIDEQMTQAASGAGWYDEDVLKTFKMLSEIPGLERFENDETARIIWSAMAAPTSIGQLVKNNTRAATAAAMAYFRTGVFPINAPLKATTTEGIPNAGWGLKQKSVESGMQVIAHLIGKYGEDGFADWWLSPHSKGELTAIRKEAGLSGPPSGVSGKADSVHLGAMVLGDKTGRFSLNINGYEGTTKDVWYSRSYNRAFGQMFGAPDKKTGKPVVQGGPRNQGERREMEAFNQLVLANTKAKGLSEADAQAILWFYEQGLYTRLGVKSVPGSFSEGVGEVHGTLGVRPAVRGSDGTQTETEPGTTLEGYRGVSGGARAVRSQRRSERYFGVDSAGIDGGLPRPYTGESNGDAGGSGRVTLSPTPEVLARYQEAGLNIPKLNELDALTASQPYHDDMTAAMAAHPYGAQVEIKSPKELSELRLFRTENMGGFAIKPDGDVVAVFTGKAEPRKGIYAIMQAATAQGGRKLDAFNTMLPKIYGTVGFKPVSRIPWSEANAPDDWDKATFAEFNNGEPDVVFFVYDPEYFGGIKMEDVPLFEGDGNYDAAVAAQTSALQVLGGGE